MSNLLLAKNRYIRPQDIKKGLILGSYPQVRQIETYTRYYYGLFDNLYANLPKDDITGLAMFERPDVPGTYDLSSMLNINYFAMVSDYWVDACFAEPPTNLDQELVTPASQAILWNSIGGQGIIATQQGAMYAIPGLNYMPLVAEGTPRLIGHLLLYPWSSQPFSPDLALPDRVTLHIFSEELGINTIQTWKYSGLTLDTLENEIPGVLTGVHTFGNSKSDYADIMGIVARINIAITLLGKVVNRHSSPHMIVPENQVEKWIYQPNGMLLPVGPDEAGYDYLSWDAQAQLVLERLSTLFAELHLMSSIPLSSFGVVRQGQSGISQERQAFSTINKIRNLRRDIERVLIAAGQTSGLTVDKLNWSDAIWSDWPARVTTLFGLFDRGAISDTELRQMALGGEDQAPGRPEPTNNGGQNVQT